VFSIAVKPTLTQSRATRNVLTKGEVDLYETHESHVGADWAIKRTDRVGTHSRAGNAPSEPRLSRIPSSPRTTLPLRSVYKLTATPNFKRIGRST